MTEKEMVTMLERVEHPLDLVELILLTTHGRINNDAETVIEDSLRMLDTDSCHMPQSNMGSIILSTYMTDKDVESLCQLLKYIKSGDVQDLNNFNRRNIIELGTVSHVINESLVGLEEEEFNTFSDNTMYASLTICLMLYAREVIISTGLPTTLTAVRRYLTISFIDHMYNTQLACGWFDEEDDIEGVSRHIYNKALTLLHTKGFEKIYIDSNISKLGV